MAAQGHDKIESDVRQGVHGLGPLAGNVHAGLGHDSHGPGIEPLGNHTGRIRRKRLTP